MDPAILMYSSQPRIYAHRGNIKQWNIMRGKGEKCYSLKYSNIIRTRIVLRMEWKTVKEDLENSIDFLLRTHESERLIFFYFFLHSSSVFSPAFCTYTYRGPHKHLSHNTVYSLAFPSLMRSLSLLFPLLSFTLSSFNDYTWASPFK